MSISNHREMLKHRHLLFENYEDIAFRAFIFISAPIIPIIFIAILLGPEEKTNDIASAIFGVMGFFGGMALGLSYVFGCIKFAYETRLRKGRFRLWFQLSLFYLIGIPFMSYFSGACIWIFLRHTLWCQ